MSEDTTTRNTWQDIGGKLVLLTPDGEIKGEMPLPEPPAKPKDTAVKDVLDKEPGEWSQEDTNRVLQFIAKKLSR